MGLVDHLLENSLVYRSWQGPFARAKIRPILKRHSLAEVERVLDVGCGPGTNARFFRNKDYLGLDINPNYIRSAQRRYPELEFQVQDVTEYTPAEDERFDFVLLNSFLHHVNDNNTRNILQQVSRAVTRDGSVHILDLVLPERRSLSRWLARMDRGEHPRPLSAWQEIFESVFHVELFEPYPVKLCGVTLWNMIYFKGRSRHG